MQAANDNNPPTDKPPTKAETLWGVGKPALATSVLPLGPFYAQKRPEFSLKVEQF